MIVNTLVLVKPIQKQANVAEIVEMDEKVIIAMDAETQVLTKVDYDNEAIGVFKVVTYFILIFYLIDFYCQIKISNLIELFKAAIYFYLSDYLF